MSQRSKLGLLQLLLAQPCADFRLYNVPRYMLYIAAYSTACVYLLTELTNWLVLSVQRSVMKMITANARCICCSVVVVVVAESCPTSGFIMPLCGKSIHLASVYSHVATHLPQRDWLTRLYPKKLFQYLHFLLPLSIYR